jgi:TolB-like protein
MRFLDELKRRKVVGVALVYAATAFVVLQAADLLGTGLALPDWVFSAITLLVVLGFPVALVLAWALELTPDGVRRTTSLPPPSGETPPSMLGRRTLVATAALLLLGIGLGAGWFMRPVPGSANDAGSGHVADARSLAVLAFADLSETADQKWFADGLAEEILTSLARLSELRVIGRNSAFLFTAGAVDDRVIADTLGVAHLLKGSVRRVGGQIRVSAQLVRATDGVQLWSASYDGGADALLDVQRDVAEKVAAALDVLLDDERRERMFATGTRNVEAFEAFLRGREIHHAVHANDPAWTLADANDWFGRALELDPGFSRAALMHSDRYSHLVLDGPGHPWVGPPALSRADGLARLRQDLDHAARTAGDGYSRTIAEINRALFAPTWQRLPHLIEELRAQALTHEPSGDDLWADLALHITGELDLARELSERRVRANPLDPVAWALLVGAELAEGNPEAARALVRQATAMAGPHPFLQEAEVDALLLNGDGPALREVLHPVRHSALLAAIRGDREQLAELAQLGEEHLGGPDPTLLLPYHMLDDRTLSRDLVRRIDALPAGALILAREVLFRGRILAFDLADAPNFTARLREAGVDPVSLRILPRLPDRSAEPGGATDRDPGTFNELLTAPIRSVLMVQVSQ